MGIVSSEEASFLYFYQWDFDCNLFETKLGGILLDALARRMISVFKLRAVFKIDGVVLANVIIVYVHKVPRWLRINGNGNLSLSLLNNRLSLHSQLVF